MPLCIYNSLTQKKEVFTPLEAGSVRMYVCGPTVYDDPHIGHARAAFNFDVIRRFLSFRGYRVTLVRNITDVDDKIIERAQDEKEGRDLVEKTRRVANRYLKSYHEAMALLNLLAPEQEPKATEHIPAMIDLIHRLVKKEAAYVSGGSVYFSVRKFSSYGKLSHQNIDAMRQSAGDLEEGKSDVLDFALWKSSSAGECAWESPWGMGRPGWHIECSAMSMKCLGESFDIHGGGRDLLFPHHENERAQSEAATGKTFAHTWIHNGLLTVNGQKMSKSLGNFVCVEEVLKQASPDALKLFFLSAHYASGIDFSEEALKAARSALRRFLVFFNEAGYVSAQYDKKQSKGVPLETFEEENQFIEAMEDDFNTPKALSSLYEMVRMAHRLKEEDPFRFLAMEKKVKALSAVLGLFGETRAEDIPQWVKEKIGQREKARREGDFDRADQIRRELAEKGIIVVDTKGGVQWRATE